MNQTYCLICSYKNLYSVSLPPFCQGCGKPLNRAGSIAKTTKTSISRKIEVDDDDDEDDHVGEFDTEKLSRAWVAEKDNFRRPTFEDLISAPCERGDRTPRPESDAGINGNDLLKQIRSECARSRDTKEVV